MTLGKWVCRADIDDGTKPGTTSQENVKLPEPRRLNKLLAQEHEVLRQSAAYLPRRTPRENDLLGTMLGSSSGQ
ncbi:hypothetical protein ACFV2Q_03815 [Streptomyces sp. NPDC059650]|uniref:hypothetical protein n=1 Tax=Streptomyces sp. NPDC059650 TaxID=3346896 RepID=UPI0036D04F34